MDRPTVAVYEREGAGYAARRGPADPARAAAFARAVAGRRLDLGCGPGRHLPHLGAPVVAADAAHAMVRAARAELEPPPPVVQADLQALPFGRHAFAGIWASKAHQHVPAEDLPMALADAHRVLEVGGRLDLTVFATAGPTHATVTTAADDDLPGRRFTWWNPEHLAEVVAAAGFSVVELRSDRPAGPDHTLLEVVARAERALPDHVGPEMRLLCCGLNPSLHAADAGVGYVTGSNRFWPALIAAGLTDRPRDNVHLLRRHGIGMTDLVKRPTPRAAELTAAEYRAGVERLRRLCTWLRPQAVVLVGLAGWRAGHDRRAQVGWQPERLGPARAYVMPSTSGLNARVPLAELAEHLRVAAAG